MRRAAQNARIRRSGLGLEKLGHPYFKDTSCRLKRHLFILLIDKCLLLINCRAGGILYVNAASHRFQPTLTAGQSRAS